MTFALPYTCSYKLTVSRNVYTQNLWSFLDVAFICIYTVYLILRIHGWRTGESNPAEQAYDVLALAAPVVVPRLAFTLLSDNLMFLALRSMMADFFALTALSAWCFFGFLLSLLWLGEGAHPLMYVLPSSFAHASILILPQHGARWSLLLTQANIW